MDFFVNANFYVGLEYDTFRQQRALWEEKTNTRELIPLQS